MGLFSRRGPDPEPPDEPAVPDDDDRRPLHPVARELRPQDAALLERCRAELAAEGLDLDSLEAIGAAYDAAVSTHRSGRWRRDEHTPYVERFGVALGEWLTRHTDLRWTTVSDVFGTDLGLMAPDDDFALVPSNIVSGRWMNGQTGWVPGVLRHLASLRAR